MARPGRGTRLPTLESIRLSVVIPAYNEEQRLGGTLQRVQDYLEHRRDPFEILVVDDGSVDRTTDVVE